MSRNEKIAEMRLEAYGKHPYLETLLIYGFGLLLTWIFLYTMTWAIPAII